MSLGNGVSTCGVIEILLKSRLKLERDKGILQLNQCLKSSKQQNDTHEAAHTLAESFISHIVSSNNESEWEPIQGCLLGLKCIIENVDEFMQSKVAQMRECSLTLLVHDEVRVRLAAGELLGCICKVFGAETFVLCSSHVLELINKNLIRDVDVEPSNEMVVTEENTTRRKRFSSVDAATIYHESAGWRYLETSMKCLQHLIEGCGNGFLPYVTEELLNLIFTTLSHENRFVRETGYYVCASLMSIGREGSHSDECTDRDGLLNYGDRFSYYLAKGLADNWSQVRLASSTATRCFLTSICDNDTRKSFYPSLLPRICLNRYYVADGVRIYSQETWRQLSDGKGRDLVETYIDEVVNYYAESTRADNHAVREAACACIAELGNKIRPSSLKPHVERLLSTLLECFKDDSWPVRDSACVACGNFIVNFADEGSYVKDELYALFKRNLEDPIPSVRQGAAGAIANFVRAYADSLDLVLSELKDGLLSIEKQPENAERYYGLDISPAQFGVAKRLRDNDVDLHSNQTMYSCGSLAPKMGRGQISGTENGGNKGSLGGCSECRFQRPSEPWERSDGCVYLLSELLSFTDSSAHADIVSRVTELFPIVEKAASYRHFTQHVVFIETICRQLPVIATRLGKKAFKHHLETFLHIIFYALHSDTPLTSNAAEDCLSQLAALVGPSILRGRIEASDARYLDAYDAHIKQRSPTSLVIG